MSDLEAWLWPLERTGDAIDLLARRAGLAPEQADALVLPEELASSGPDRLDPWVDAIASRLGLEAEMVSFSYPEVERAVGSLAPGLVAVESGGKLALAALVRSAAGRITLLGPSLEERVIPASVLAHRLRTSVDREPRRLTAELLAGAGIPESRRERALGAVLDQRLAQSLVSSAWILRPGPSASFWRTLLLARIPREAYALIAAHAAGWLLFVGAWWMIGRGALEGRADAGWLVAWALLLLSTIPASAIESWVTGKLFVKSSRSLKQRLLHGALSLEPDEIRHQGAGQLLARVFESEAIEALALGGGFVTLLAVVDLVLALLVLGMGAGSGLHVTLLLGWSLLTALLARRYFTRLSDWTALRNDLTSRLVERMVGHRTRLAQEPSEERHLAEDQELSQYLERSRLLDRFTLGLVVLVPSGWLAVGLAGLVPALLSERSPAAIAVALGGILLAHRALSALSAGLGELATAAVSW
jgi:ATP-binding cassette, subfamily B, bacterial